MFLASILAHISLGALLALIFVLYYMNGDGKWKIFLEILLGTGGNIGGIFLLSKWIDSNNTTLKLYSIASCISSFLIATLILLVIFSFVIKDKDDKDIIRLRDIMLGQTSWINKYYEKRAKEIDGKLNISKLEEREKEVTKKEEGLKEQEKYIEEELEKLKEIGNKKLKLNLPEKTDIVLTKDYIDVIPSYINDICRYINDVNSCTKLLLTKSANEIDLRTLKSYFISLATYISSDIFGGSSTDVRIHFRIYDETRNGYKKLIAVIGKNVVTKPMTFIPYDDESLIKRSYECKRALIKSINTTHNFTGNNYTVWQDYMTYTFYNLKHKNKPYLSFGISVKNATRYKKMLHFLNYFRIESFLQDNIEQVNEYISIADILYGGSENG